MSQNLLTLLRSKFKEVRVAKAGADKHTEYKICCPYCPGRGKSPDKSYKLYINGTPGHKRYGAYQCWRCGKKGSVSDIVKIDLAQVSADAASYEQNYNRMAVDKVVMPYGNNGGLINIAALDDEHPAIQYLTRVRARTFDPKYLSTVFNVHYCNIGRLFANTYDTSNTLIFPITMIDGTGAEVIKGWQSRLLYDPDSLTETDMGALGYQRKEDGSFEKPPKYFTMPGIKKGSILYNFSQARRYKTVVVVEGVFDAFAVGPAAVATFGKGLTETQINLLKTYWDDVVLLLDPGDASRETSHAADSLRRDVRVTEVSLKDYKDAGDAPTQDIWDQIAACRNLDDELRASIINVKSFGNVSAN